MCELLMFKADSFGLQAPVEPPSGQEGAGVLGGRRLADVIWSPEAALPVDITKKITKDAPAMSWWAEGLSSPTVVPSTVITVVMVSRVQW